MDGELVRGHGLVLKIDPMMELLDVLKALRAHGVKKFKGFDLDIEFEAAAVSEPSPSQMIHAPIPPNMPPDLRNIDLMNEDQIRNWSASPDNSDQLQGTDELPATPEA